MGECLLARSACAAILSGALLHFHGERCELRSFVIMPNHAHVLVRLAPAERLETIVQSWKGFTARRINRLLERRGRLWQEGYWDRMVRNENHLCRCMEYIRRNPGNAKLSPGSYLLWEK